jgi:hypothetical protein
VVKVLAEGSMMTGSNTFAEIMRSVAQRMRAEFAETAAAGR